MPNLKVLYLMNNPVVKKIKNYRKTIIAALPNLKYLDDRPVFVDDRRHAEAFSRGGLDEERKERDKIKQEKNEKDEMNRQAFKDMIAKARAERKAAEEKLKAESAGASAAGAMLKQAEED
jgi:dynein assembly factor 1